MNTLRRTEPTRGLLQGGPYVSHWNQDTDGILSRWKWERSSDNPANYPEPDDESLVPLLQMSIEMAQARKAKK